MERAPASFACAQKTTASSPRGTRARATPRGSSPTSSSWSDFRKDDEDVCPRIEDQKPRTLGSLVVRRRGTAVRGDDARVGSDVQEPRLERRGDRRLHVDRRVALVAEAALESLHGDV